VWSLQGRYLPGGMPVFVLFVAIWAPGTFPHTQPHMMRRTMKRHGNSGGGDQEDHGSRPAWVKSWGDPISINKPGVMVQVCHPSYAGGCR
jgi:hypothetical protein